MEATNKYFFAWDNFGEKELTLLNNKKNSDIYGCIYITDGMDTYIVDVEYETKEMYGRNGISLNVYESDSEGYHVCPIEEIKSITTATNYKRFKTRAENAIANEISLYKREN